LLAWCQCTCIWVRLLCIQARNPSVLIMRLMSQNIRWRVGVLTLLIMSVTVSKGTVDVRGDVGFPAEWTVFAPFERDDPLPEAVDLRAIPAALRLGEASVEGLRVTPVNNQYNFTTQLGEPPAGRNKVAYAY